MLIECLECGKKISNKAHSCPNCGNPSVGVTKIVKLDSAPKHRKIYRIGRLIFTPIFWMAIFFLISSLVSDNRESGIFWLSVVFISFVGKSISKIGDWFSRP